MKNFGENLKEHRLVRGYTLKEIERATGINNGSLSRWERNEVLPSIESCILLANLYDITLDELLGLDDLGTRTTSTVTSAGNVLSSEERQIIEQYRSLPEKLKKLVQEQLDVYCAPSELLSKTNKKV